MPPASHGCRRTRAVGCLQGCEPRAANGHSRSQSRQPRRRMEQQEQQIDAGRAQEKGRRWLGHTDAVAGQLDVFQGGGVGQSRRQRAAHGKAVVSQAGQPHGHHTAGVAREAGPGAGRVAVGAAGGAAARVVAVIPVARQLGQRRTQALQRRRCGDRGATGRVAKMWARLLGAGLCAPSALARGHTARAAAPHRRWGRWRPWLWPLPAARPRPAR